MKKAPGRSIICIEGERALLKALSLATVWLAIAQPVSARICLSDSADGQVPCFIINECWDRLDSLGIGAGEFRVATKLGSAPDGRPAVDFTYVFRLQPFTRNQSSDVPEGWEELEASLAIKKRELAVFRDALETDVRSFVCDDPDAKYFRSKSPEKTFVRAGGIIHYRIQLEEDQTFTKIRIGAPPRRAEIALFSVSSCEVP